MSTNIVGLKIPSQKTTEAGGVTGRNLSIYDEFSNRETRLSTVSLDPTNSTSISHNHNHVSNNSSSNTQLHVKTKNNSIMPPLPQNTIEKMRNMALTIIGVTVLFIVFTVPINIYVPIMHLQHQDDDPNVKKCDDLVFCLLNNMVNANHSTSFFIYLSTNSKFKNEIKLILENFCAHIGKSPFF